MTRHVLEAGTDGAVLALFDPAALPEGFDALAKVDPGDLFQALGAQGRMHSLSPHVDFSNRLHVYVDEPVPDRLVPHLRDPVTVERFLVPSGRLHWAGGEYAFRDDDAMLRQYPHMGSAAALPPGTWRLTFWKAAVPVDAAEREIRERMRGPGYGAWRATGAAGVVAAVSIAAALAAVFLGAWRQGMLLPLGVLVALPFAMRRSTGYRAAARRRAEAEREIPSFVALLERTVPFPSS